MYDWEAREYDKRIIVDLDRRIKDMIADLTDRRNWIESNAEKLHPNALTSRMAYLTGGYGSIVDSLPRMLQSLLYQIQKTSIFTEKENENNENNSFSQETPD